MEKIIVICFVILFVCFVIYILSFESIQEHLEAVKKLKEAKEWEKFEEEVAKDRTSLQDKLNQLFKNLNPAKEMEILDYLVGMSAKLHDSLFITSHWEYVKPYIQEYLHTKKEATNIVYTNKDVREFYNELWGRLYHNGIESDYNLLLKSVMFALNGNVYGTAWCLLTSLKKGTSVFTSNRSYSLKEDKLEAQEILNKLQEILGRK